MPTPSATSEVWKVTVPRQPLVRRGITPAGFGAMAAALGISMVLLAVRAAPATGPGATAVAVGRAGGVAAGYAALIQLLLRARVPAIERGFGVRTLSRWHACLGATIVMAAVGHVLAVSAGYAAATRTSLTGQFTTLVADYPWVPQALTALIVLSTVAVLSLRRARSLFGYGAWHLLHCSVYVAVLLALGHQLAVGDSFRHHQLIRVAWVAVYAAVFGSVIWYRLLRPWWLSLRHRLTVAEVVRETPDVVSVRVTGRDLESLHADAGQYFRWRFLASRQWQAAHPYSLSRPPEPDSMRITVKAVGRHSSRVAALRPGTRVIAEGPCGGFTAARRSRTNVLLIAGGVGITPLRSLFESLCPAGGTITLLYRVGARAEVLFDDELQAIAEQTGKEVSLLLGHRADLGYDPLASGMLVRHIPDLRHRDIYLCGPRGMAHTVRNELRTEGVARRHLFTESFGL